MDDDLIDPEGVLQTVLLHIADAHEQNDGGRPANVTTALATIEELVEEVLSALAGARMGREAGMKAVIPPRDDWSAAPAGHYQPEEGDPCPTCGKPLQWDSNERMLFCEDDYKHG